MGASYAAREGGTSRAKAPEEQQQQEQQEQQLASQQMFQVCSEYRNHAKDSTHRIDDNYRRDRAGADRIDDTHRRDRTGVRKKIKNGMI